MRQLLRFDFVRFCLVGASGFLLNFALLALLYRRLGINIFLSQLVSSEISLFSNFLMHNFWTYKHKTVNKTIAVLLWQFHATSWVAIIGSSVVVALLVNSARLNYILALVISSGLALMWNFAWTKFVIWKHDHNSIPGGESVS